MPRDATSKADRTRTTLMGGSCTPSYVMAGHCMAEMVDHQLVLRRRLHRKVARLLALEHAINVARGTSKLAIQIGPVGDKAARGGAVPKPIDRRQFVTRRKSD